MVGPIRLLREGGLFSLAASACLLLLMRFQPRLFLRHLPQEMRSVVPPRSEKERWMSIPFGLLIGLPFALALLWRTAALESHSFRQHFVYAFGVLLIFNLVDLLLIDWLIVCWWRPRWAVFPGTEQVVLPSPYRHHFNGFMMGLVGITFAGLAVAGFLSIRF